MTDEPPDIPGTLRPTEPHPAAFSARDWLRRYLDSRPLGEASVLAEVFASTSLSGNRLGEVCSETLRRLMAREPVSDRYLLGLAWTIRDMAELQREGSPASWVAVEDRLPVTTDDVYAWWSDGVASISSYRYADTRFGEAGRFWESQSGCPSGRVTHWSPLPGPPSEPTP